MVIDPMNDTYDRSPIIGVLGNLSPIDADNMRSVTPVMGVA